MTEDLIALAWKERGIGEAQKRGVRVSVVLRETLESRYRVYS